MLNNKENLQTTGNVYYVPMEVTDETIKAFHIDPSTVEWTKFGIRRVRAAMVKASKEVYDEYMRSEWKEDKFQQRHGNNMSFLDNLISDYEIKHVDGFSSVEGEVMKREFLNILCGFLSKLEEIDRTIVLMRLDGKSEREIALVVCMSQRGVGKRKKRLLDELQEALKDFRNFSFS